MNHEVRLYEMCAKQNNHFFFKLHTVIRQLYHPFHLHGFHMHVVGMGQQPVGSVMSVALAKEMSRLDTLVRMPMHNVPPIKDTISIPSRGYTIVRFIADNPGFIALKANHFDS
jgi:FtsP/CotA-like multicopper oxidase with cupredoxin domain